MPNNTSTPSIPLCRATVLVAEDDGPSGQFFTAAFAGLGCRVVLESNGEAALARARKDRFDLLLLDCRMPGAGALRILSALVAEPGAASHGAPAIATSAELDARQRQQLQQAGFADALSKPIALDALHALVEPWLPAGTAVALPVLDDQAALASSGTPNAVVALRGLFARELRHLTNELDPLAHRPADLAERLHRLLASCGFCGAHALAEASRRLKRELTADRAPSPVELQRFRETLLHTLQALGEHDEAP